MQTETFNSNEASFSVQNGNTDIDYEQEEIIPVQISGEELPMINLDAADNNVFKEREEETQDSNDILSPGKLHPINTNIKKGQQQANPAPLNSAGSASETISNAWTSVSNYLLSWFEPQSNQQQQQQQQKQQQQHTSISNGPKSAPLLSSSHSSFENVISDTNTNNININANTNNNNNNNNTQTQSTTENNSTGHYSNIFSSFFGRPANENSNSNMNTLKVEKKASNNNLSSSRLNLLSKQAMMASVQFIGREEQENVEPIVNQELTEYIRPHLPVFQRESSRWHLRYSTAQHGISLNTLYQQVEGVGPLLLAIRDSENNIFGAYVSEPFHISQGFYGTRECFLWKYVKGGLKMYPTSGSNELFIHSEADYIAIGGGDGNYGLYIDEDIQNGQSSECIAFFNEPLSTSTHFQILSIEIWSFEM
ncbi:TLD-domain-containing protein [Neocallimastix lanati (nom. inval.)]|uniref:Oxidation resistance protein 1 n=1 Tax=Neocallimastix californiae TaxID=1754190 RepID=A0A1Y2ALP3_9FUNG|nr:TLD-domain-containing protein [Neocallimastix sp. JGI-2020a]ORY23414.1 TLD-domain-containing protein [Neocallimastix californiae]|eukprot:ORY23414.1 TLD-domain-containing protein [Neocallimastix californiae]